MAELRWNPKATACFQRKGVGTILVIGKVILQFDANYKLLFRKEVKTFYQGMQEAMLLVGASVTNAITEPVEIVDKALMRKSDDDYDIETDNPEGSNDQYQ